MMIAEGAKLKAVDARLDGYIDGPGDSAALDGTGGWIMAEISDVQHKTGCPCIEDKKAGRGVGLALDQDKISGPDKRDDGGRGIGADDRVDDDSGGVGAAACQKDQDS